ncbi:hypothetical protein P0D72_41120, partial [Paraburkholderia sediminicola]|uniref:hypothetical protein n=1 Tax=Paraburkholderia sediminicola TaxID=458836 RepID=UPI0038B83A55
MTNTVSLLDAAELSLDAYNPADPIPADWAKLGVPFRNGVDSFTVFIDTITKTVLFAFKGTDSLTALASDLVNQGTDDWENIRPQAQEELTLLQGDPAFAGYTFVADGHSLGGGMAQTFALENNLDGFGQNSLPIASGAIDKDYKGNTDAALTAFTTYESSSTLSFQELNVNGDIATWWYQGGMYLDPTPTPLASDYSGIENSAISLAKLGMLPAAVVALVSGVRAHSIKTVVALLEGQQAGSAPQTSGSASDMQSIVTQAAPTIPTITSSSNLSFNENLLGPADNPDLSATYVKLGSASSSGGVGMTLKVSDANGGTGGTLNTLTSDVYESGKL